MRLLVAAASVQTFVPTLWTREQHQFAWLGMNRDSAATVLGCQSRTRDGMKVIGGRWIAVQQFAAVCIIRERDKHAHRFSYRSGHVGNAKCVCCELVAAPFRFVIP